jgi:hypothetical protein
VTLTRRIWLIVTILIAALVGLALVPLYVVRETAQANLFWNSQEAFFLVKVWEEGRRFNVASYIGQIFVEVLGGGGRAMDDIHCYSIMFEITKGTVTSHRVDGHCLERAFLFSRAIYVTSADEGTLKWSEGGFVKIPFEEGRTAILGPHGREEKVDDYEGWSERPGILSVGDSRFVLPGSDAAFEIYSEGYGINGKQSLKIVRPGSAQDIWDFSAGNSMVGRVRYWTIFKPKP